MRRAASSILSVLSILLMLLAGVHAADPVAPATVAYRLPTDGPLPRTWRVTLAIVDPRNPDWIVSQFACGVARTVTAENGGRFSETWDGLDDNFMPVPPGDYAVKGICMPAERWAVDGDWHSVTPRFVGGVSPWLPPPDQAEKRGEPFHGDPVGTPIADVAASPDGVAVFYYGYLENGLNNPLIDLRKPLGPDQFIRAFPSGGAGGGASTATDGETVWSFSWDGGKYVYRADGKAFGSSPKAMRTNSYQPEGWVEAMAAWRDPGAGRSTVFIAQGDELVEDAKQQHLVKGSKPVDVVTVHDGADGKLLARLPLARPRGLAARGGRLYGLHAAAGGFAVSAVPLVAGVPQGTWTPVVALPAGMEPGGLAVDGHGRIYVSEPAANRVHQFSPEGRLLRSYGRLAAQEPGAYDRETFMHPLKLAAWTDAQGQDRLLVVEQHGPCRVSEWSAAGALLREFPSLQTAANDGWTVDPEHPEDAYIAGQGNWLSRYRIDYASGRWTLDAVWPEVGGDPLLPGFTHCHAVRFQGRLFLASCPRDRFMIYRLDGQRWKLAAGVVRIAQGKDRPQHFAWRDANGDGRVDEAEFRSTPMTLPGHVLRYHGEQVAADLSLLALDQDGTSVWRLPVASLDERGIPVFGPWERALTDPVFTARAAGTATALFGGTELTASFDSDWAMADGDPAHGYWVVARGGRNFSANAGSQEKVSRYVPDGKGGQRLRWRTGRAAITGVPRPGEIVGAIHLHPPINGLLPIIDQSRCGVILYTEDGLYVDSLFPNAGHDVGVYALPGEFFAGMVYPDAKSGAIFIGVGKDTPLVFRAEGWSLAANPARPLPEVQPTVSIAQPQIAAPPEVALAVRGGAGAARIARFAPALGGVEHDGSLEGWETCEPVAFQADPQRTVEARCLYDPEHLHLRIHVRTGGAFSPKPLRPVERVFSHERASDAVSFYIQGDPAAKPGGPPGGRAGDARFILGLFDDEGKVRPALVALHPRWAGAGAHPQAYQTPVGRVAFEHVGEVAGAVLGGVADADGKGYVVSASIPRAAIPGLPVLGPELRTSVDFEATFGGHAKVWWANRDGSANVETYDEPSEARLYPGAWAPAQFAPLDPGGVVIRQWLACGPFGGPGAERFDWNPSGKAKDEVKRFFTAAVYGPDREPFDAQAVFTGEQLAGYWPAQHELRWRPAAVADLDTRVVLGKGGAEAWFATTWVRTSAALPATLVVQGQPQAEVRLLMDGQQLFSGPCATDAGGGHHLMTARVPVTLQPGWHRFQLRSFCFGYAPLKAGLAIEAAPEQLWGLRLSGRPPAPKP